LEEQVNEHEQFTPAVPDWYSESDDGPQLRKVCSLVRTARTGQSGCWVVQLIGHLDHRPAEPYACEEPLRGLVLLGGRQHHAWYAARPEKPERGVEEQPADALAAMLRVDDDVVQDARRPAQRHVVVPLDGGVGVANHVPVIIGDEDGLARLFELRAHEGRIALRCPRSRGQKAPRVEVVMLLDEERAEAADPRQVGRRRTPDDGPGLGPELSIFAQQKLRSILQGIPDGDIAKMREVIQLLTRAIPLSLPLSLFLDKDEVHYRVPGVVNTSEE
jgi:hypothetical protein